METLNIEAFDPKAAELKELALACRNVDESDLKAVKENRIKLKNARVAITKQGKEMRDGANAFAKAVIAKEKELIGLIEPEEERLKAIEDEAERLEERKKREQVLPQRREQLLAIDGGVGKYMLPDENLLDLDSSEFQGLLNKCLAEKNEADRVEIARVQEEQRKEAERLEFERTAQEREEKARQAERERIEREQKEKEERQAEQERIHTEQLEKERLAKEAEEAEKKRKLEASAKFQEWLKEKGYTAETAQEFKLVDLGDRVQLFKLIDSYTK